MKDKQMMDGTIGVLSADKPLSEPSEIAKRLENIDKVDGFTSKQQIAIKQFMQEYGLRQQGKDPDGPSPERSQQLPAHA